MADILSFKKAQAQKPKSKPKSKGLCQHGFHQWKICNEKQFDVQQGRLVTVFRCGRCNARKVKSL